MNLSKTEHSLESLQQMGFYGSTSNRNATGISTASPTLVSGQIQILEAGKKAAAKEYAKKPVTTDDCYGKAVIIVTDGTSFVQGTQTAFFRTPL